MPIYESDIEETVKTSRKIRVVADSKDQARGLIKSGQFLESKDNAPGNATHREIVSAIREFVGTPPPFSFEEAEETSNKLLDSDIPSYAALADLETGMRHISKAIRRRTEEWSPGSMKCDSENILFTSNELGGEAGELQNVIKKIVRNWKGIRGGISTSEGVVRAGEEMADVIITVLRLADQLGIDITKEVVQKFNSTSDKEGLFTRL